MQTTVPTPSYTGALFFARADSDHHRFYTVAQVDGRCPCGDKSRGVMHCQCPDHLNRARDCKHIKRALRGEAIVAMPKRTPAAAVPAPADDGWDLLSNIIRPDYE